MDVEYDWVPNCDFNEELNTPPSKLMSRLSHNSMIQKSNKIKKDQKHITIENLKTNNHYLFVSLNCFQR